MVADQDAPRQLSRIHHVDGTYYCEMKEDKIPYIPNDNTNWTLDVRTSWAFANGKLLEDGDGGEHIECFCLSLLLVS